MLAALCVGIDIELLKALAPDPPLRFEPYC
jgi:hypothetical protein